MQPDLDRAAAMACRCLLRMNCTQLPVRPMEMLRRCRNVGIQDMAAAAEENGIPLWEMERLFAAADAFTFRKGSSPEETAYRIVYRADGNPARLNFTLAHELGHIVLGHHTSETWEEQEADCFASHLLCPEPVRRSMAPLPAERMAGVLFVSVQAVRMIRKRPSVDLPADLEREVEALFGAATAEAVTINSRTILHPPGKRVCQITNNAG